jgi:hypothetical protein
MDELCGTLTPKTNKVIEEMRFTGGFGQPTGFGSVLIASVREDGSACLSLHFSTGNFSGKFDHFWSVILTNEQRRALSELLARYQPRLFENTSGDSAPDARGESPEEKP